ncbi:glycoside hydrolase family 18 protein [Metabacillus sediminilitoris]|uniref:chitinase n=1 Tax=Metabacillus sediminilitoris TaxID=2567941 RepID=A0A4S4BVW8_9BACI|nr:glycoside hydrolase family 18 protein [Metabacillus sediminilitoris]QGQ46262.1 chitinase [Metabacillus sediminilitoris]THF79313.1 glycoside hydrolase family 18 protein [Metabacillus sediminilitoris]
MKKHYVLLIMTGLFIFLGGLFSGVIFSENNLTQKKLKTDQSPLSAKQLKQKQFPKIEHLKPKVLIGYVQDFRDPASIDYTELTHVIFSFAHPARDGKLLLNGESALSNLRLMVQKAHQADKKAMLAVGGWYHIEGGESYDYFKAAISNPVSRHKLINELIGIADRENLDGIDIDFEHPRSKEDAHHLAVFTKSLSEKLHAKDKEISIAVYSKIHSVTGTEIHSVVFEPKMFNTVDHINIMAYDGQWDGEYNAANLSPYSFTVNIVDYWSKLFDKHGISKEKLVLGVPSYAQPEDLSIKQVSYAAILNKDPANAEKDRVDMNGTTYHYNGVTTIQKKTNLALENGFGGMMLWELGLDAKGSKSITNTISEVFNQEQALQKQYAFKSGS